MKIARKISRLDEVPESRRYLYARDNDGEGFTLRAVGPHLSIGGRMLSRDADGNYSTPATAAPPLPPAGKDGVRLVTRAERMNFAGPIARGEVVVDPLS